jgi:hypothetical protein
MAAICISSRYHVCSTLLSIMIAISSANAMPMAFNFSGIVQDNSGRALFPGKSIGDSYAGTFTVDPNAPVLQDYGTARNYDGDFFSVTVEDTSYSILVFNVWLNGVEFDIKVGSEFAFLSLRSTTNLYANPDVPTSYDIGEFDELASIRLPDPPNGDDHGSILAISSVVPEPASVVLFAFGSIAVMWWRRATCGK